MGSATLDAQTLTTGSIAGTVHNALEDPVSGVVVQLRDAGGRVLRTGRSNRQGVFSLDLVFPGAYQLRVELLGYRPLVVQDVAVRPSETVRLQLRIFEVTGPAVTVDTVSAPPGAVPRSVAGGRWIPSSNLYRFPDDLGDLGDATQLATTFGMSGVGDGLSPWFGGFVLDGVRHDVATNPWQPVNPAAVTQLPRSMVSQLDIRNSAGDVEWLGRAGSSVAGQTHTGTRVFDVRGGIDWSGDPVARSKFFAPEEISHTMLRAAVSASGPIVSDSASFRVGIEVRREDRPVARAWERGTNDEELLAALSSADEFDLAPYLGTGVESREVIAGFARSDVLLSPTTMLTVGGSAAIAKTTGPLPELERAFTPDGAVDETEAHGMAALSARVTSTVRQELRAGLVFSERDFTSSAPPLTLVASDGALFGRDPVFPGTFRLVGGRISDAFVFDMDEHHVKLGAGARIDAHELNYLPAGPAQFAFGSPDAITAMQGVFAGTTGGMEAVSFTTFEFGAFAQDEWSPGAGLRVRAGLRIDAEALPIDDLVGNAAWTETTGTVMDSLERLNVQISPRAGFEWDPGRDGSWTVSGDAGLIPGDVPAHALAELIGVDGRARTLRAVGSLGSWPDAPASAVDVGAKVALAGPSFGAPSSFYSGLGVVRSLSGGWALGLYGTYRHTNFLIRRHDLNRLPAPLTRDQDGRPIYGNLVQVGQLLAPSPGSNRRFGSFDLVSALDQDGFSDYWALTVSLDKPIGEGVVVSLAYTFSRTIDNVPGAGAISPEDALSPFPDSLDGVDWVEGRSDYDVPHRFVAGVNFAVPGMSAVRFGGVYRMQSGRPFTPGFRDGVDINADGSGRNDPAFLNESIDGTAALVSEWPCLAANGDQSFVERNACRAATVHQLDLRASIRVARLGTAPVELVIDAINVIEPDRMLPDRALYLVDDEGMVAADPVDGTLAVPLVINPAFGEPLIRRPSARRVRIGARFNW